MNVVNNNPKQIYIDEMSENVRQKLFLSIFTKYYSNEES